MPFKSPGGDPPEFFLSVGFSDFFRAHPGISLGVHLSSNNSSSLDFPRVTELLLILFLEFLPKLFSGFSQDNSRSG